TGLPRDTARRDRYTWVHLLQPYVKNGDPRRIDNLAVNANVDAPGMWRCPSFNVQSLVSTSNQTDCDGPRGFDASDYARQYSAHYGLVTPNGPTGSCTQQDPYWNSPGSNPFQTDITGSLGEISRPAETALVTDGALFMTNWPNNAIGFLWGCDAG